MTTDANPSLEEFLDAPIEEVAKVSPTTIVYAQGGTRRSASFANISPESDEYVIWSSKNLASCADLIFKHGVTHIFTVALTQNNFKEVGKYRQRLLDATALAIAGPQILEIYAHHKWRVRLLGSEDLPELAATAERLIEATEPHSDHTIWYTAISDHELYWEKLFRAARQNLITSRKEAIQALCGEDVPLATLFLGMGKPTVFPSILPPILYDKIQCYWRQQPGFHLTENEWRTILYDYAYVRSTWKSDKQGRSEKALLHQEIWETAPPLGIGQRLGAFWYPAPIPPVTNVTEQNEDI